MTKWVYRVTQKPEPEIELPDGSFPVSCTAALDWGFIIAWWEKIDESRRSQS